MMKDGINRDVQPVKHVTIDLGDDYSRWNSCHSVYGGTETRFLRHLLDIHDQFCEDCQDSLLQTLNILATDGALKYLENKYRMETQLPWLQGHPDDDTLWEEVLTGNPGSDELPSGKNEPSTQDTGHSAGKETSDEEKHVMPDMCKDGNRQSDNKRADDHDDEAVNVRNPTVLYADTGGSIYPLLNLKSEPVIDGYETQGICCEADVADTERVARAPAVACTSGTGSTSQLLFEVGRKSRAECSETRAVKFEAETTDTCLPYDPASSHLPSDDPSPSQPEADSINEEQHELTLFPQIGSSSYKCSICECLFTTEPDLRIHHQEHADASNNNLTPMVVNSKFERSPDKYNYKCAKCDMLFRRKASYLNHMRFHKDGPHVSSNECDICHAVFASQSNLDRHRMAHDGENKFQCQMCDHVFRQKYSLLEHMQTHSTDKTHNCSVCGSSFARRNSLLRHLLIHGDVRSRSYVCDHCQARFLTKQGRDRHLMTHNGVRNHACDVCGREFLRKDCLQQHVRIHSLENKHTCVFCGRMFTRGDGLVRHMTIHRKNGCVR